MGNMFNAAYNNGANQSQYGFLGGQMPAGGQANLDSMRSAQLSAFAPSGGSGAASLYNGGGGSNQAQYGYIGSQMPAGGQQNLDSMRSAQLSAFGTPQSQYGQSQPQQYGYGSAQHASIRDMMSRDFQDAPFKYGGQPQQYGYGGGGGNAPGQLGALSSMQQAYMASAAPQEQQQRYNPQNYQAAASQAGQYQAAPNLQQQQQQPTRSPNAYGYADGSFGFDGQGGGNSRAYGRGGLPNGYGNMMDMFRQSFGYGGGGGGGGYGQQPMGYGGGLPPWLVMSLFGGR